MHGQKFVDDNCVTLFRVNLLQIIDDVLIRDLLKRGYHYGQILCKNA